MGRSHHAGPDRNPSGERSLGGVSQRHAQPGRAVAAHPAEIKAVIDMYSGNHETIVYCACPNDASAATAAKHLWRAGFKRIRPLQGEIDAWVEAGHPIERHAARMAQ